MNNSAVDHFNSSNNNLPCNLKEADWSRALKTFAVFLVGGCGIFGNLFIIVLAVKYTVRRNLHHMIINMAVADTVIVLAVFVTAVPQILDNEIWSDIKMISGNVLCKMFSFFVYSSMNVSFTSLIVICIERFRASRQTVRISQPYTLKQRITVVGSLWLVAVVFSANAISQRTILERLPGVYTCQGTSQVPFVFRVTYFIMCAIATCCIVAMSTVTLRRMSSRQEIERSLPEVQRKAREKRIACAMKMVLSSWLLYICSYLPFGIWNCYKIFLKNPDKFLCLEVIIIDFFTINMLPLINSCFSPVIYLTLMADFREAARKLFKRNERIAEDTSNRTEIQ